MMAKHRATFATLAVLVLLLCVVSGRGAVQATPSNQEPGASGAARLGPVLQAGTTVRIDYGSKKSYTDKAGNLWLSDRGYLDGETVDRGNIAIANTEDDPIYQTERYNVSGYTVPVANGSYTVRLHFAETYSRITGAGQRVFNMYVEGVQINNIDIFAEAGGKYIALIKTVNVTVIDGQIDIGFTQVVQYSVINGIEVLPALPAPTATSNPPPTNTPLSPPTNTPPPPTNTRTHTPTRTPRPPTNTRTRTPTRTPQDPTDTSQPATNTPTGPTSAAPTSTRTRTPVPPTRTPVPPTNTPPRPTRTATVVPGGAPPRPVHLALIIKMPAPPPACGDIEDADDAPASAGLMPFGITCAGSLQTDELYGDDWFYVNAPAGKTLVVDLSGMPSDADYDLFLFDATLDELASAPQIGSNAPEHIEYRVNTAGKYYIRIVIYQQSAAADTYLLRASTR